MKKISEIYTEYKIVPGLQEHMLRVAAVASLICDNFNEPIDRGNIILAGLFHDMGNIIKTKMDTFPDFFEPEGVDYWQGVKDEYIRKYGGSEHEATVQIMQEIGLPEEAIDMAGKNIFSKLCEHKEGDNINLKILHYADGRVAPRGVVSYLERMGEARVRYELQNKDREAEREKLVDCGAEIEKQIFSKCKINPEDINDETIKPIISELRDFVVK